VIALPPLFGAVKDTVTSALPDAPVGCAGALGIVLGTAAADAADGAPSPFAFVAVTVHVYVLPFVSAVTTSGDAAPVAEPEVPLFVESQSAVYPVMALPPSGGAVKLTAIWALAAATAGCAGADGTVLGITAADAGEAAPAPFAFVAVTVHVYDFPFASAPTTIGEPAPDADPAVPPFDDTQFAV
jgi:hypothetical protein